MSISKILFEFSSLLEETEGEKAEELAYCIGIFVENRGELRVSVFDLYISTIVKFIKMKKRLGSNINHKVIFEETINFIDRLEPSVRGEGRETSTRMSIADMWLEYVRLQIYCECDETRSYEIAAMTSAILGKYRGIVSEKELRSDLESIIKDCKEDNDNYKKD